MPRSERRWVLLVVLAVVVLSNLPYVVAWAVAPPGTHFGGLVFSPADGYSYLAKLRQGYNGSWRFHLPYTPEPHAGGYLYLYHLALGHLARLLHLPLVLVYHAARLAGGAAMLVALYGLARRVARAAAPRSEGFATASGAGLVGEPRVMFLLAALGAGLGWLVVALGVTTADLWVPEAFPVYALLTNAHFPLAIALMIAIARCGLELLAGDGRDGTAWGIGMLGASVLLGVVQPFGLLTVFGGLAVAMALRWGRQRRVAASAWGWSVAAGVLALPYPIYMQLAIHSDPVLSAWNAQNTTPSPAVWDWALSFGVILALAVPGLWFALRRGSDGDWLLAGWALVTLVGMYLPLPLQRRLSLGLGVPLGLLAGMGWWRVLRPRVKPRRRGFVGALLVASSALTPLFLVLMSAVGASAGEPWYYIRAGERAALEWLRTQGNPEAVVLCAPQTGVLVPALAGQRVVYGHPFETVNAEARRAQVEAFFAGRMTPDEQAAFLRENRVGYVLAGPREEALSGGRINALGELGPPVFRAADVRIYALPLAAEGAAAK
jgi:hypothetical protein